MPIYGPLSEAMLSIENLSSQFLGYELQILCKARRYTEFMKAAFPELPKNINYSDYADWQKHVVPAIENDPTFTKERFVSGMMALYKQMLIDTPFLVSTVFYNGLSCSPGHEGHIWQSLSSHAAQQFEWAFPIQDKTASVKETPKIEEFILSHSDHLTRQ